VAAQPHETMFYELMWRIWARCVRYPVPWWLQSYFRDDGSWEESRVACRHRRAADRPGGLALTRFTKTGEFVNLVHDHRAWAPSSLPFRCWGVMVSPRLLPPYVERRLDAVYRALFRRGRPISSSSWWMPSRQASSPSSTRVSMNRRMGACVMAFVKPHVAVAGPVSWCDGGLEPG
jgi:hypothetical protein